MSTEITRHSTNTALTIAEDQTGFTDQQIAALRQIGLGANTQADVEVFFHQAKRSGLDPFRREIYMITRKTKNGPKATIQTGIDGFYKIADRVTRATGGTWGIPETLWCGPNGQWRDVWLEETPPAAAKVTVERNGSRFTTVATSAEYNAGSPMWQKMPARMIAKCAEAQALRKAFPEIGSQPTAEEMEGKSVGEQAAVPVAAEVMPTVHPDRIQALIYALDECATVDELQDVWTGMDKSERKVKAVEAAKDRAKERILAEDVPARSEEPEVWDAEAEQ